jgi:hypothetical protein
MRQTLGRLVIAAGLVGLGWAAGRAQNAGPDFELVVDAPVGQTSVECRRGCTLAWVERGVPDGGSQTTFTFRCGGAGAERCSSYAIGGWVKP